MRRLVASIDQSPGWLFVAGAVLVLGIVRAGWMFSALHRNFGGVNLTATLLLGAFLLLLIFSVRRRHIGTIGATVQLLEAIVLGNTAALLFLWPFLPHPIPLSLGHLLVVQLLSGFGAAAFAAPAGVGLLWLSRRYGSHSLVTERRLSVVLGIRSARPIAPATTEHEHETPAVPPSAVLDTVSEPPAA